MKSGPPSFLLSILQRRFDAFDELEHSFKALKLDASWLHSMLAEYLYRQQANQYFINQMLLLLAAMMTGFAIIAYLKIQTTNSWPT